MNKQNIACISLSEEDVKFLGEQKETFCLSKFVRGKLKEYRDFKVEVQEIKDVKGIE